MEEEEEEEESLFKADAVNEEEEEEEEERYSERKYTSERQRKTALKKGANDLQGKKFEFSVQKLSNLLSFGL